MVTEEDHLLDTSLLGRFERFQIEFDRVIEVDPVKKWVEHPASAQTIVGIDNIERSMGLPMAIRMIIRDQARAVA